MPGPVQPQGAHWEGWFGIHGATVIKGRHACDYRETMPLSRSHLHSAVKEPTMDLAIFSSNSAVRKPVQA